MRPRRRALGVAALVGGNVALFAACGDDGGSAFPPVDVGNGADATALVDGAGPDSPSIIGVTPGGCEAAGGCDGGACIHGACCAAASICDGECCAHDSVCVFGRCVTPGHACHSNNDCAGDQYCETGLGGASSDAGAPASDAGRLCTQAPAPPGRCVARPPLCAAQDGGPDAGGDCIAACEFHPPVGAFNTVTRWQWGFGLGQDELPDDVDIWSTPVVGRIYDGNCDDRIDELDTPSIVFVSGDARTPVGVGTCCQCTGGPDALTACHRGVLRAVDGRTGQTVWSLARAFPASVGFAGLSTALADIDGDGRADVVAVTGEGYVVVVNGKGEVVRKSDKPIEGTGAPDFGWGGGLAVADVDHDGFPEIAYGATIFTTKDNKVTRVFVGIAGLGGEDAITALSTFADLDGDPTFLELLAGNTAYAFDGTSWSVLWTRGPLGVDAGAPDSGASDGGDAGAVNDGVLTDGFSAIADFDRDGNPEAVLVTGGLIYLLDAKTGVTVMGPLALPGELDGGTGGGFGGPPTVADFDGDGKPEIGVAQQHFYSVVKPDLADKTLRVLWQQQNHDLSSSVTGSTVFDFEGDGKAEVIYADECYLWVWGYDPQTGKPVVRFATPHTSFTATEASLVADVDGDGHAEIIMVSNRADPSRDGWGCDIDPWNKMDPATGRPAWVAPAGQSAGSAYRGLVVFGDRANSWVGTRTLWSQHGYHVSNICDDRDTACGPPNVYASVPRTEAKNWTVPWLDNFRQNVQDKGIFDAPDGIVRLAVDCTTPVVAHVSVQNQGLKSLPAGVNVGVYDGATRVGEVTTTRALGPGQTETLDVPLSAGSKTADTFTAKIILDPQNPTYHQCREDNDESPPATATCVH